MAVIGERPLVASCDMRTIDGERPLIAPRDIRTIDEVM